MPGKEMEMPGEEERDRDNRYVPETFLDSATPHAPIPIQAPRREQRAVESVGLCR